MDDCRSRPGAFGNARAAGSAHARLPAMGQPAREGQDGRAALPGIRAGADSGRDTCARRRSEGDRRHGRRGEGADRAARDRARLSRYRPATASDVGNEPARRAQRLRLRLRGRVDSRRGRGCAGAGCAGTRGAGRWWGTRAARRQRRRTPDPDRGPSHARTGRPLWPVRHEYPRARHAGLRGLPGRPLLGAVARGNWTQAPSDGACVAKTRLQSRSGASQRYSAPPARPPTIGATQNSHNWASAPPPANSATPVERAGFTEVLVTGMLIRWIRVSARPIAIGAKPAGARRWVAPMMTTRNIAVSATSLINAACIE